MTARTSFLATQVPDCTFSSFTTQSTGHGMAFSIFIASRYRTGAPFLIKAPTSTAYRISMPGMGAFIAVPSTGSVAAGGCDTGVNGTAWIGEEVCVEEGNA